MIAPVHPIYGETSQQGTCEAARASPPPTVHRLCHRCHLPRRSNISRGIYRKTRPWLHLHGVDGDTADITFDSGRKSQYPLYTGLSDAIFEVYAHPWEMKRSTAAAFDDDFWLVSHRWSDDGMFFDLQRQLDDDDTRRVLERGDVFVPGDGSEAIVREIATSVRVLSFDAAARKAMVKFERRP